MQHKTIRLDRDGTAACAFRTVPSVDRGAQSFRHTDHVRTERAVKGSLTKCNTQAADVRCLQYQPESQQEYSSSRKSDPGSE